MTVKEIMLDFIEWAKNCGEDAWFIFDEPEKAIEMFFEEVNQTKKF